MKDIIYRPRQAAGVVDATGKSTSFEPGSLDCGPMVDRYFEVVDQSETCINMGTITEVSIRMYSCC